MKKRSKEDWRGKLLYFVAHSTDLESPEDVHDLTGKCVSTAEQWDVVADELWRRGEDRSSPLSAGAERGLRAEGRYAA